MGKKLNYIIGTAMVAIGISLAATMYKYALESRNIFPFLMGCISLIGGGLLLIYITKEVHGAAENLQRVEQSTETPQVLITLHDDGRVEIEALNMNLSEVIAALEISKTQLITRNTISRKPVEIVRKP